MARSSSYSWMPGWLRKFLNLDDEMPGYGPSSGGSYTAQSDYAPAAPQRQSFTYTPPAPTYTPPPASTSYRPSSAGAQAAGETTPRFASSYTPTAAEPAPRPAPPRTIGPTGSVQPDGTVSPGGNAPSIDTQGYVQPISYGLRSYARGALPPQGLEQFTREFRATLTDVWNFYNYWTRFQTDELVRIGREAMDTVVDNLPSSPESSSTTSVRRIKVTVGNGNGEKKVDRVATTTTVDPPPEPTPAAPPAPPATTARFSSTVTADDAEVPPEGRDQAAAFAARMAATAGEVQQDVAEKTAAAADAAAETAEAAADKLSDATKDPGDETKSAG